MAIKCDQLEAQLADSVYEGSDQLRLGPLAYVGRPSAYSPSGSRLAQLYWAGTWSRSAPMRAPRVACKLEGEKQTWSIFMAVLPGTN